MLIGQRLELVLLPRVGAVAALGQRANLQPLAPLPSESLALRCAAAFPVAPDRTHYGARPGGHQAVPLRNASTAFSCCVRPADRQAKYTNAG